MKYLGIDHWPLKRGKRPFGKARTACCAAVVGTTTWGTAGCRTVTTTPLTTGTTTTVSAFASAHSDRWMSAQWTGLFPVPSRKDWDKYWKNRQGSSLLTRRTSVCLEWSLDNCQWLIAKGIPLGWFRLKKNHPKGSIRRIPLERTPWEDALGMAIIPIPKITVQDNYKLFRHWSLKKLYF